MEGEIKKFDFSNRVYRLTLILILIIAGYLFGQLFYQMASLPENAPQSVTVSGEGTAYVKPDIAKITLGFRKEGKSVQSITEENTKVMNKIIDGLKALGVEEKDLKTTQYSISPQYNWTEKDGRVPAGYVLDQNVEIKIRNFDNISKILSLASTSGANMVGGLQFEVDDEEIARAKARQEAIKKAKAKAKGMAEASGLKLVKIIDISESYRNNYPQPMYRMGGDIMLESAVLAPAPTIQVGQQEVNVTVNLTYRVK